MANLSENTIRKACYRGAFPDSLKLSLGDSNDVTFAWDGTDADLLPAANNSVLNIGNGTLSFDTKTFGSSASNYVLWDASANTLDFTGAAKIDLSSTTPASHPINLESITLPTNCNVIRGASINPTRTSGWISFSGTVSATPEQVYTDYRNLTTTGVAEVLGIGSFPMMATGASCASMFGLQSICQVDSGATVLTASAAQGVGIYPLIGKVLIDGATVDSGAQIAAAWLSVQANVTDISARASAIIHMEVASGALRDIIYVNATGGATATNFLNFSAAAGCVATSGSDYTLANPRAKLTLKVGANTYYVPGYVTAS